MTDDERLTAVRNLLAHGSILPDAEVLDRLRALVGAQQIKGDPGPAVHCALCLNFDGERITAEFVIDGYSLCEQHYEEVLDARDPETGPNDRLWFNTDNTLNVVATVLAHRKAKRVAAL